MILVGAAVTMVMFATLLPGLVRVSLEVLIAPLRHVEKALGAVFRCGDWCASTST